LLGPLVAFGCVAAVPVPAAAQPPQIAWKGCTDWGCIGQVKMNVTKAGDYDIAGTYNFSFFSNDEVAFEELSGLRLRKLLLLSLREPRYLFFGVSGAEEAEALRARYQTQLSGALVGQPVDGGMESRERRDHSVHHPWRGPTVSAPLTKE